MRPPSVFADAVSRRVVGAASRRAAALARVRIVPPRPASEPAAVPTAYELATPEERAAADAILRALRLDLAAFLLRAAEKSRRAARM